MPARDWTLKQVDGALGKNAAYAVLALEPMKAGMDARDARGLWDEVRVQYRRQLGEQPAAKGQGPVRLASILFREGQIV